MLLQRVSKSVLRLSWKQRLLSPGQSSLASCRCLSSLSKQIVSEKVDVPSQWYNLQADLPQPMPPPLHPGELRPCGPDDFAPLFPMSLIEQEVSTERYIDIPEPVRDVLSLWRPSPLYRAKRWEEALGLPSSVRIFYKYEGGSPSGSHKTNTAVAQIYYNKQAGTSKVTTETGAGQWGSALAWSGKQFDMPVEVYQVKVSYEQKPYRKAFIETCGADIYPSPSKKTQFGTSLLENEPDCPGSLGIAISEAIEACVTGENAKYSLGSVLSHVLMHQTVIGLEAIEQMGVAGEYPDVVGKLSSMSFFMASTASIFLPHDSSTTVLTCHSRLHGRRLQLCWYCFPISRAATSR